MPLTVKELREILSKLPQDDFVIMSSDGEGNKYSPLSSIDSEAMYKVKTTWKGDVYQRNFSKDYFDCIEQFAELREKSINCVVLYPVS